MPEKRRRGRIIVENSEDSVKANGNRIDQVEEKRRRSARATLVKV